MVWRLALLKVEQGDVKCSRRRFDDRSMDAVFFDTVYRSSARRGWLSMYDEDRVQAIHQESLSVADSTE